MVITNYFVTYATQRDKNLLWNILHWHLGSVNVPGVRLKLGLCESKILSISINYGISHNQDTQFNSMGHVSLYVRNDIRSNTLTS
jgi:O-glycosyl hydrolase